jgi:hypothetical protein
MPESGHLNCNSEFISPAAYRGMIQSSFQEKRAFFRADDFFDEPMLLTVDPLFGYKGNHRIAERINKIEIF